ncbi:MAG: hypothetical protein ACRDNW_18490 [Trebonia sp.]
MTVPTPVGKDRAAARRHLGAAGTPTRVSRPAADPATRVTTPPAARAVVSPALPGPLAATPRPAMDGPGRVGLDAR